MGSLRSSITGSFLPADVDRLTWPRVWNPWVSREERLVEESALADLAAELRQEFGQGAESVEVLDGNVVGVIYSVREVWTGYVLTDKGDVLVQRRASNEWGFELADDDQAWPGGFGVAETWTLLPDSDPHITPEIEERLGFLLE